MPRSDNALFKRGAGCKKRGLERFNLRCGSRKTGRRVCLPSAVFPSWKVCASSRKSCYAIFLQSLNCSCCYLYRAFRKAGNFLIAMNIFCAHNTTGKSYFLHLSESRFEAARKKIPRKRQDARVRKKGFLYREKVHIFFPDRRVWNGTFSGHQSLNLLM